MEFKQFETQYQKQKKSNTLPDKFKNNVLEFYKSYKSHFQEKGYRGEELHSVLEYLWYHHNRPYYNVYPVMFKLFDTFDISKLNPSQVSFDSGKSLCLNFPVGYKEFLNILVCCNEKMLYVVEINQDPSVDYYVYKYNIKNLDNITDVAVKYAIIALFLDKNSELIEPHILAKDMEKYKKAKESGDVQTISQLTKKSTNRRGQVGWTLGATMETIPHYRSFHFGLRWTGSGRKIPKIVPVKACIVKRKKVETIPTGHLN